MGIVESASKLLNKRDNHIIMHTAIGVLKVLLVGNYGGISSLRLSNR